MRGAGYMYRSWPDSSIQVATLDIAGTFLDFAGIASARAALPSPMTTISLRGLMDGREAAIESYRPFVSYM